ncbi:MAG: hypothetical protein JO244_13385, partial [Solirubrobacterales bacterium]|nr:hypothetical protein [Solirubrobacterales bacterium]
MSPQTPRGLIERLRHPQTTVRWRLTLLYGGLFLVCGATLLAVTYALVAHASGVTGPGAVFTRFPPGANIQYREAPPQAGARLSGPVPQNVLKALKSSAGQAVVRSVVVT